MEDLDQIRLIAKALDDKKAKDIVVLDLRQQSSYLTYFIIATALSRAHLKTLFDEVHNTAVAGRIERTRPQSPQYDSGWVTYDLGFYVVHLFEEEKRNFYNLENIWKAAIVVDLAAKRSIDLTPRKGETESKKPTKKVVTKKAKKTSEKAKSFAKKKTTIKKKTVKEIKMATAKKKPAKKAKKAVKKAKKTTKKK
jgi:ribosome-associated protein